MEWDEYASHTQIEEDVICVRSIQAVVIGKFEALSPSSCLRSRNTNFVIDGCSTSGSGRNLSSIDCCRLM